MKATLVLHSKEVKGDEIVEIKIWRVAESGDMPHGVKYSIVYIKGGRRLLGYDNAEGKGDHRHLYGEEHPYAFKDVWTMLDDFKSDVKKIRRRDWDEG